MAPLPLIGPSVTTKLPCVNCSPELLSAVAAAFPALAYPFLPSGPEFSCGSALVWSSSLNLFLFHFMNTLAWAFELGHVPLYSWVLPLTSMSYLVGLVRAVRRHYGTQIRRDDFDMAATIALWVAIYQACRVGHWILPIPERIDSPESVVASLPTLLWDVAILNAASVFYEPFTESARTVLCRIATRRVRWWVWLAEDDAGHTFRPLWSVCLSVVIHVAAPVLL